ncbi:MAG: hypothetical protein QXG00_07485 [Candidatus Woesearchaeota archaeon]
MDVYTYILSTSFNITKTVSALSNYSSIKFIQTFGNKYIVISNTALDFKVSKFKITPFYYDLSDIEDTSLFVSIHHNVQLRDIELEDLIDNTLNAFVNIGIINKNSWSVRCLLNSRQHGTVKGCIIDFDSSLVNVKTVALIRTIISNLKWPRWVLGEFESKNINNLHLTPLINCSYLESKFKPSKEYKSSFVYSIQSNLSCTNISEFLKQFGICNFIKADSNGSIVILSLEVYNKLINNTYISKFIAPYIISSEEISKASRSLLITVPKEIIISDYEIENFIELLLNKFVLWRILKSNSWKIDIPLESREFGIIKGQCFIDFNESVSIETVALIRNLINGLYWPIRFVFHDLIIRERISPTIRCFWSKQKPKEIKKLNRKTLQYTKPFTVQSSLLIEPFSNEFIEELPDDPIPVYSIEINNVTKEYIKYDLLNYFKNFKFHTVKIKNGEGADTQYNILILSKEDEKHLIKNKDLIGKKYFISGGFEIGNRPIEAHELIESKLSKLTIEQNTQSSKNYNYIIKPFIIKESDLPKDKKVKSLKISFNFYLNDYEIEEEMNRKLRKIKNILPGIIWTVDFITPNIFHNECYINFIKVSLKQLTLIRILLSSNVYTVEFFKASKRVTKSSIHQEFLELSDQEIDEIANVKILNLKNLEISAVTESLKLLEINNLPKVNLPVYIIETELLSFELDQTFKGIEYKIMFSNNYENTKGVQVKFKKFLFTKFKDIKKFNSDKITIKHFEIEENDLPFNFKHRSLFVSLKDYRFSDLQSHINNIFNILTKWNILKSDSWKIRFPLYSNQRECFIDFDSNVPIQVIAFVRILLFNSYYQPIRFCLPDQTIPLPVYIIHSFWSVSHIKALLNSLGGCKYIKILYENNTETNDTVVIINDYIYSKLYSIGLENNKDFKIKTFDISDKIPNDKKLRSFYIPILSTIKLNNEEIKKVINGKIGLFVEANIIEKNCWKVSFFERNNLNNILIQFEENVSIYKITMIKTLINEDRWTYLSTMSFNTVPFITCFWMD